jgi:hypothetical protein
VIVVGLGHQAQVGKDTAAGLLVSTHGFIRQAFADTLKDLARASDPIIRDPFGGQPLSEIVDYYGWERAKEDPQIRGYLQRLGVGARDVLGEDVWVRPVLERIQNAGKGSRWVITDVRFPNEFKALRGIGARLIKMTRHSARSNAGTHVSETALADAEWDAVIKNDGDLTDLERSLVSVIGLD